MADYHAVLNRTLSGFTDPKPELRGKLYERARATIQRQLEGRNPPLSQAAFDSEIEKLEVAIAAIEQKYNPTPAAPAETAAPEVAEQPAAPQVVPAEPQTLAPSAPEPLAMPAGVEIPPPAPADPLPELEIPPMPEAEPVAQTTEPQTAPPQAEVPQQPVAENNPVNTQPATPVINEAVANDPIAEAMASGPMEPFDPSVFDPNPTPKVTTPPASEPAIAPAPAQPVAAEAPAEPQIAPAAEPAMPAPDHDPMKEWAKEFLVDPNVANGTPSSDPVADPAAAPVAAATADVQIPTAEPAPAVSASAAPVQPQAAAPSASIQPPTFEPVFSDTNDADLSIPPAPSFTERRAPKRKKGGLLKWILLLLILLVIALAGFFIWQNASQLGQSFNISSWFSSLTGSEDDPAKPKPVKTITIRPEAEVPATPETKSETRLTPDGQEVNGTSGQSVPLPDSSSVSTQLGTADSTAPSQANGTLPIAQNALLYEEGATESESTIDTGRIIWSVVQEEPSAGKPKEPAIRGRVEVPSRNVTLIMTIKRNGDEALPASHLIELVFAVPDDFSGGAIGQINRFVLKESEQGRGDGLIGVPARIADGIFLIALNNLEDAVKTNENLLLSRSWIDIPLQYRTGRRALLTLEKGLPGEQVFIEVFDAWKAN